MLLHCSVSFFLIYSAEMETGNFIEECWLFCQKYKFGTIGLSPPPPNELWTFEMGTLGLVIITWCTKQQALLEIGMQSFELQWERVEAWNQYHQSFPSLQVPLQSTNRYMWYGNETSKSLIDTTWINSQSLSWDTY